MVLQTPVEIEYPESDGKPMGETDVHRWWMIHLFNVLDLRFRGANAYVSSDLLLYYEEGNPSRFVVPDVFVVKDCQPGRRRVFKLWEEGRVPNLVFEVTSRATRRADEREKRAIYEQMGVRELFLFDPTRDYLDPSLQGFRLVKGQYERIREDASGHLVSAELDALLVLRGSDLLLLDRSSKQPLLTEAETERANAERERLAKEQERLAKEQERVAKEQERMAKEQERMAKEQERAAKEQERLAKEQERMAREQEQARRVAAEEEVARLREVLEKLGKRPSGGDQR